MTHRQAAVMSAQMVGLRPRMVRNPGAPKYDRYGVEYATMEVVERQELLRDDKGKVILGSDGEPTVIGVKYDYVTKTVWR